MAGVFVTGASGFVARNIRRALVDDGFEVVSASRRSFEAFGDEIALTTADYTGDGIPEHIGGFDAAIHLVGSGRQTYQSQYRTANLDVTDNVIRLCQRAGVRRIIYLSGLGVSPDATLCYFISKYQAEQAIIGSGLEYAIFRPSYIIGKDDYLTRNLARQASDGSVVVPGSGRYAIQPISIDDVVRVLERAVSAESLRNSILDMVGPQPITFREYVEAFAGRDVSVSYMDMESAYREAILSKDPRYDVDDLNILVAGFVGDHDGLRRATGIAEFRTAQMMLEAGCRP